MVPINTLPLYWAVSALMMVQAGSDERYEEYIYIGKHSMIKTILNIQFMLNGPEY